MPKKKAPQLGKIFSSSSSDDSLLSYRKARTSASDKEAPRKVRIKVNLTSVEDKPVRRTIEREPIVVPTNSDHVDIPDGYILYDKRRLHLIPPNTIVGYQKTNDKVIVNKYFKQYDQIGSIITVGFYKHDKRNYSESLSNIAFVFTKSITGGDDPLKNSIEVPKAEWKGLNRDMVVSYQKLSEEWIYHAKFNSFIKIKDGSERISFTSERGYGYIANPDNIKTIRRHITPTDRMTTFLLESISQLERRVAALEKKKSKK
jgi:hypothetical protein